MNKFAYIVTHCVFAFQMFSGTANAEPAHVMAANAMHANTVMAGQMVQHVTAKEMALIAATAAMAKPVNTMAITAVYASIASTIP